MDGIRRDVAEKTMPDTDVGFAADMNFGEFFCAIDE